MAAIKLTLAIVCTIYLSGVQGLLSPRNATDIETQEAVDCNFPTIPRAFLRAYNGRAPDHFYTIDDVEMQRAASSLGYAFEGVTGYIFKTQYPNTVPLYRLYNGRATDHFYTTDIEERDTAVIQLGYTYENIAGYVFESKICGSQPLYRLYSGGQSDHFYTMSATEASNASKGGYTLEGIAGYIYP